MKLIAEIGLNHLGNDAKAISIVKKCLDCDIDGITLQVQPAKYYDNKKNYKRELKKETYIKISKIIKRKKKLFGLALMDVFSYEKYKNIKFNFFKILSTAFNNKNLIDSIYSSKKKVYISTGVADLNEIKKKGVNYPKVNFVHTSLSDKAKDANISAINNMKKNTKNEVSFGLHSKNYEVIFGATSFSPHSIFFYIKPDKNCYYPDDKHAIKIKNISNLIKKVRLIESCIGNGNKSKKKIPGWVFK